MQYGGPDHQQPDRTLAGFARHPNVAAYLLIGLGCETGQAVHLIEGEGLIQLDRSKRPPTVLSIQQCGGSGKTVEDAGRTSAAMLPRANDVKRKRPPAKH